MLAFETTREAHAFVRDIIDMPTTVRRHESVGENISFDAFPLELGGDCFTNIYDVSFREGSTVPRIHAHNTLTSVFNFAKQEAHPVATGGGFFYLVDVGSAAPKQLALNFSAADYYIRSLPVVDRETIVCDGRRVFAKHIQALGTLSLNGQELSWSGSLTSHETEAKVFGNGNAVITHIENEATGSARVLDESSRFTPAILEDDTTDVGFIAREDGIFIGKDTSKGGLDIFAHDLVLRCNDRYLADDQEMKIHTVGSIAADGALQGALSVGPMLKAQNFNAHQINKDKSLGSRPPFVERRLARAVLYATEDGTIHVRLFDGRPGSERFTGVTPSEVVSIINAEGAISWGCFLDPGQTAKLCVTKNGYTKSYGNRHYLKWAIKPGEKHLWVPDIGRPTGSAITLQ